MAKSTEGIAEFVVSQLKAAGFKILRYNSYSTSSIYLKLDYGVCNSIRISDHKGKKHLQYRYNLIKGLPSIYSDTHGKYPRYYYPFAGVNQMVSDIIKAREEKLSLYGEDHYKKLMQKNIYNNSDKRGFWEQCFEV